MVSSAGPVLRLFESNISVNIVADMSAEHQKGADVPMISTPDTVICEGQQMTFELPNVNGSGELENFTGEINTASDLDPRKNDQVLGG